MKLYRVTLKGMQSMTCGGTAYGCPYVVANNPSEAEERVKKYVNKNNLRFSSERELEKIELLAEEGDYPNCQIQLFLPEGG